MSIKQTGGVRTVSEKFESKQLERIYGLVDTIFMNYTLPAADNTGLEITTTTPGHKMCLIKEDDAVREWSHGFSWPQWTYYKRCFFVCWYEQAEPVNVVLRWTSWPQTGLIYGLRNHLLSEGYTDTSGCALTQYVYDEGVQQWRAHDVTLQMHGDCFSSTRYHNRMWALSNGYDAVSEHYEHLHVSGHHVHNFEAAEDHLADHAATKSCYSVQEDDYWLDNYLVDPYNNGYATRILFLSGC